MKWYLAALKKYATFSGRAHRSEFWFYVLFTFIVSVVLAIIDTVLGTVFLGPIYSLATLLPSLAVGARRLHDTGRSGWWQLIGIVPLIGVIVLIVFFVGSGKPESNQYGDPPPPA
jgi:uncharacterized membrane protein YhaH (DUF805 family)